MARTHICRVYFYSIWKISVCYRQQKPTTKRALEDWKKWHFFHHARETSGHFSIVSLPPGSGTLLGKSRLIQAIDLDSMVARCARSHRRSLATSSANVPRIFQVRAGIHLSCRPCLKSHTPNREGSSDAHHRHLNGLLPLSSAYPD